LVILLYRAGKDRLLEIVFAKNTSNLKFYIPIDPAARRGQLVWAGQITPFKGFATPRYDTYCKIWVELSSGHPIFCLYF
jgi:hypothetical protein